MNRTILFTKKTCFTVAFLFLVFLGYSQSKTIYYENFDANNGGWTSSNAALRLGSWSYNANPIVGEGSYWSLNRFNDYENNYLTRLTSPVIPTAGFNNVTFYIDIRYKTEVNRDGMNIEYTTDPLGLSGWTPLGSQGQGTNWYNDNDVNGIGNNVHGWSGTNIEGADSPSKFIEASISSSNVTALNNATSLRFRINFGSDNGGNDDGVAIDNVIIKGDYITPPPNPTRGPGNINGNLKLWLKANVGTNSSIDNSNVTSWGDQADDNSANGYSTFAPKYRNDASRNINFNPVVDFSRSGNNVLKGKGGYWSKDYYVVVKTNSTVDKTTSNSQEVISGKININNFGQDGTGLGFGRISSRFNGNNLISHMIGDYLSVDEPWNPSKLNSYGRSYAPPATNTTGGNVMILNIKSNTSVIPNVTEIYLNGKKIDNHTGTRGTTGTGTPLVHSDFNNSVYQLGVGRFTLNGFPLNTYLDGRITEVASYSTARTAVEQQKIQSYLGIKNGVTLHATGSTTADNLGDVNYIDSNGDVIWDVAANTGFNYDIAGIGKDDNTLLTQKQSKSENPNTVLTIGLGDITTTNSNNPNNFGGDRNYLMWGSNNGTMSNSGVNLNIDLGPTTITTITEVVNRKWKVVEKTGIDVGTVRVNIPTASFLSGLPALGATDAYVMVVATNATFTTGLETVFMSTSGGNQTCLYDFDGTKYISFGVAHRATNPLHITLDGVDDYVRIDNSNELPTVFSVMTWIRPNGTNTLGNERTILSKKSAAGNGYQIVLQNDNRVRFEWYDGSAVIRTAITNTILPNAKWHNIAYTYTTNTLSIYIDGVLEKTVTMAGNPGASTGIFSIGGQYITKNVINNLFKGDIDELRMWNRVLTATEIQFIMNQEILQSSTGTIGTIIPSTITKNDINTLLWINLFAYYSMNSYIGTHLDDDSVNVNRGSLVIPDKISINVQTAPMPYISAANGLWQTAATWTNGANQDLPYSLSIINDSTPIDWNIVRTTHNVFSEGDKTVLGLFVNSNTLSATNDSKIEVSHYLKLNGKIDLVGRSQLVQKLGSDLDATSSGSLERDQQGQANKYNYNYWSSPVGTINNTTNNNSFTVAGVLRDGTNTALATPALINWVAGYDGSPTTPISLARYWIYKFDNLGNNYANWTQIFETGPLEASKGFTLKGSGTATADQNLTFLGKPNNGAITNTVGADQLLLIGNPYPSALDANKFIDDNIGSIQTATTTPAIDGALYFWEHFPSNASHNLGAYRGGYAIYNKTGGLAPSSVGVDFISGSGTASKLIPNQFIPVGQGFFVIGKASTGGTVTFNNSQREFIKEGNASSQTTYRIPTTPKTANHWTDNSDTVIENDTHKKIRLGFNVIDKTFHRQVLLAFMDEKANSEMNDGYDAFNIDDSPSDMYLLNGENELAIQGEGYFDEDASFPIAVRTEATGKVSFGIDALENFDQSQNIFIYDKETDTYNSIKNKLYEVELSEGYFKDRFSLRFTDKTLGVKDVIYENSIQVAFTRSNNVLNITNGANDNTVVAVSLFNIQGKLMSTWDVSEKEQTSIKIPIQNKTSGVYIVKLKTSKGNINKKIIIK
ncbi:LamG-like jellyroll fold domain-containing protein [Flavobacterium sp. 120]|uniref:LamG-like jellyroll fold domain-containing protein n=1 Tax=Flavobacterium sp. 120 TaxID=2135626 RepID=UPI000EB245D2|nr:LamG-like jellyroll fold domain-containing protein [Flavobacterium sp. 120]RKS13478.1 putative secreted protein (Por secretion system target) [Flavobacterium sp. 120]